MPLDIGVRFDGTLTSTNDLGVPSFTLTPRAATNLQQGTAASQADLMFADTRTIAASGTDNLDLTGTALNNVFGVALALVKVKAIYVKASAANTNNVVIGAGTNPFSGPLGGTLPTITVPPGGEVLLTAPVSGWTVTAATGDILKIVNSAGSTSVDYDIIIAGTSA